MSIAAHKKWLAQESCKVNKDIAGVNLRMKLTLADRKKLVNEKNPIKEIKEQYPILFSAKEVYQNNFIHVLDIIANML